MVTFYTAADVEATIAALAGLDLTVEVEDATGIFDEYPTAVDIYTTRPKDEVTAEVHARLEAAGVDGHTFEALEQRSLELPGT